MKRILQEGLDYHDLVGQLIPTISIDEYAAKMGDDDEIVTISFIVKGTQAAKDLVDWFERGYDFVLDAQVSDGEISPGKYLVFVEMNRRTTVPSNIVELLSDLETLTNLTVEDWTVKLDDDEFNADEGILKKKLILSPKEYREAKEESGLNEMRELAGVEVQPVHADKRDSLLKDFMAKAGL